MPWKPRTIGETLLPSGEKDKEEEEGGLPPPPFRWRRNAAGAIIITAIYTNTSVIFTNIFITFPLLGNVVISKKFLRTRKIMVMHSNDRGECCPRTLVYRKWKR